MVEVQLLALAGPRPKDRREFERPHPARSGVAKPLNGIERTGESALRRKPRIDQRIPEFVGQRVGQHSRQPVK